MYTEGQQNRCEVSALAAESIPYGEGHGKRETPSRPLFSQQSPGFGVEAKGGVTRPPPPSSSERVGSVWFPGKAQLWAPISSARAVGRLLGVCALLDHRLCAEAMADPLPNLPAYTCFLHPPTRRAPGPWLRLQCFDSAESWVQVRGTLRRGEG